jgi:hypothetical protein
MNDPRDELIEALKAERDALIHDRDRWAEEAQASTSPIVAALTADNVRLRDAMTFYADEENYKGYTYTDPCGCCSSWYEPKIHIDGEDSGHIARAAIAALNTRKETK